MKSEKKLLFKISVVSITGFCVTAGLYYLSSYSFLLFHTFAEIFSIIIAVGIFIVAWNTRVISGNNYLLFLGIAFLFIGFFDLLHSLSYKGMNIIPGYDANLPTQMWIIPRYIQSVSFLLAPLFLSRKLSIKLVFSIYIIVAVFLTLIVFTGFFPDCYIESSQYNGLTPFKIWSEYIISIIFIAALIFHVKKFNSFDKKVFILIMLSMIFTIFSEILFTFYISVYGISNFFGHIFKIIAFFLIYKCIIETCLRKPYTIIFHDLKAKEKKLLSAFKNIKTLHGLLPICAACKKIRDDKGYWRQIEIYLKEHSEADFTHGLCPDCEKKLYPEYTDKNV